MDRGKQGELFLLTNVKFCGVNTINEIRQFALSNGASVVMLLFCILVDQSDAPFT